MFENPEIERDDLPQAEAVAWLGMDEKFVRRLLTEAAIGVLVVSIGIFGFSQYSILPSPTRASISESAGYGFFCPSLRCRFLHGRC